LIRFYYDIVCPFAYVASRQIQPLAHEAGVAVEWVPVLLGGILKSTGAAQRPMDRMHANKARLTVLDAMRQAELAGLEMDYPAAHPMRTVTTMRLLHAVEGAQRVNLTHALYRAYWVDGVDMTDLDALQRLAAPFGLDVRKVDRDPACRTALFDATQRAVDLGAFGVPTIEVDGRIFWGADRLHLVRQALGLPRHNQTPGPGVGARVRFFHDFSSPYSYLASTQVARVCEEGGAALERVPFLLGALFKQLGTPIVPIATFSPARRTYQRQDMLDWADWWGVPFRFPSQFPLRTVTALRVAIAAPETTDAIYRAAWVDDVDIGDKDALRAVLDGAGFDGHSLLLKTQDASVKQQLFTNTARAMADGACGAPSFVVDNDALFWGQDRLAMVTRSLAGWRPPTLPQ
jgi:2-hydroxychromene-2-carboxylate isomerase